MKEAPDGNGNLGKAPTVNGRSINGERRIDEEEARMGNWEDRRRK